MFGIGLPEMLLIMALALIVIGPDKLPDLARSLAKGLMELKKTAETLKTTFAEEGNPLKDIQPELEEAAKSLKNNLLELPSETGGETSPAPSQQTSPADMAAEAYQELLKQTGSTPSHSATQGVANETPVPAQPQDPPSAEDSMAKATEKNEQNPPG